ncbi:uncharacterized protein [Drosophila virilis]|uniref:uncharacterized protein isoform X2 n=1 Tax=Drosophila virilis TaxID=7244 RepID=UPI0013963E0C|nr:uncharacterized protein LOC116650093 isoform X2 [Drosophila virilis]
MNVNASAATIDLDTYTHTSRCTHKTGHVRAIVGLPGVEKGSAEALRELSDKINSHLRALGTMSTTEELADGLLIQIISHKLDHHTQKKWQEALATENPKDLKILTPGHSIWGKANATIDEPDITHLSIGRLRRWQRICHMQQSFWKKWSTSYLSLLQERGKCRPSKQNLQAGSIVLLKEDNAPPLRWPLGRVDSFITDDDGIVRVAVIRTQNGLVKRAIAKIAVLPIETTS